MIPDNDFNQEIQFDGSNVILNGLNAHDYIIVRNHSEDEYESSESDDDDDNEREVLHQIMQTGIQERMLQGTRHQEYRQPIAPRRQRERIPPVRQHEETDSDEEPEYSDDILNHCPIHCLWGNQNNGGKLKKSSNPTQ